MRHVVHVLWVRQMTRIIKLTITGYLMKVETQTKLVEGTFHKTVTQASGEIKAQFNMVFQHLILNRVGSFKEL